MKHVLAYVLAVVVLIVFFGCALHTAERVSPGLRRPDPSLCRESITVLGPELRSWSCAPGQELAVIPAEVGAGETWPMVGCFCRALPQALPPPAHLPL